MVDHWSRDLSNVQYIHSAACLCIIGASSQAKSLVPCIGLAKAPYLVILHTDSSFNVMKTFNLELTVLPPSRGELLLLMKLLLGQFHHGSES